MVETTTIRIQSNTKARLDTFRVNGQSYNGLMNFFMDILASSNKENLIAALLENQKKGPAVAGRRA